MKNKCISKKNKKVQHFFLLFLLTVLFLVSCSPKEKAAAIQPLKIDTLQNTFSRENDIKPIVNLSPIWYADLSNPDKNIIRRLRVPDSASLTVENLIATLNLKWINVQLVYDKNTADTLFVKIPDSEYLSQRMGSSGAEAYMAEAVYTLTELNGIKKVDFQFEEGDHAVPGTYQRKDFDYSFRTKD